MGHQSQPGALLKISFPHGLQYAKQIQYNIIILTGEDDTTGFNSWRYSYGNERPGMRCEYQNN
jgi:hypothetical protein